MVDFYSAFEDAYAQTRHDAFIVTTSPDSFIGSEIFVCNHLSIPLQLNHINDTFTSNICNVQEQRDILNRLYIIDYEKIDLIKRKEFPIYSFQQLSHEPPSEYRNGIISFTEKTNDSKLVKTKTYDLLRSKIRNGGLNQANIIRIFDKGRNCIEIKISFDPYNFILARAVRSKGFYFEISQILVDKGSQVFKSIRRGELSQSTYQSLKENSDRYGFNNILNSGRILARTCNST